MREIKYYIKEFKKYGYKETENISDFWFENKKSISKNIFKISGEEEALSLKIRWMSDLGKVCQQEVYNYINNKQLNQKRIMGNLFGQIDFNDFSFLYNNEKYDLKRFGLSYETSHIANVNDLRGINLDGITINLCEIKNCFFALSSFKGANFQQNRLINSNLNSSDFSNSRFIGIIIDKKSKIGNINFKGALVNAIDFKDESVGESIFPFSKISYFRFVKHTLYKLCNPYKKINYGKPRETIFLSTNTTGIKNTKLARLKHYIDWYQNYYTILENFKNVSIIKRVAILISAIFTKHWSSLGALAFNALLVNVIFGILIYFMRSSFGSENLSLDLMDSFYLSVVTFSSLGFGDVVPINWIGQLIVIINVILGYIVLDIFVYLLTNKIIYKY